MSEWSNVHAWKACIRKRIGGSNPLLSAITKGSTKSAPFCYGRYSNLEEDLKGEEIGACRFVHF